VTAVEMVATYLRRFPVPCSGGLRKTPLEETIPPISKLQKNTPWCRSFLDISDPENPKWKYPAFLGVSIGGDLKFYLQMPSSRQSIRRRLPSSEHYETRQRTWSIFDKPIKQMFSGIC